jgi:hypothetical protein
LSEAGQQEATTSAASDEEEEEEEEEGKVISVHCTASLWRRGTSIPQGYVCSTVFPHSTPSSRLLTPQEKNTENRIMRYKEKEKKEVKNEAGERCDRGKNACSFYWSPQPKEARTQQHLFPRCAWNFSKETQFPSGNRDMYNNVS